MKEPFPASFQIYFTFFSWYIVRLKLIIFESLNDDRQTRKNKNKPGAQQDKVDSHSELKKPKSIPGFEPGLLRQNAIAPPLVPPPMPRCCFCRVLFLSFPLTWISFPIFSGHDRRLWRSDVPRLRWADAVYALEAAPQPSGHVPWGENSIVCSWSKTRVTWNSAESASRWCQDSVMLFHASCWRL